MQQLESRIDSLPYNRQKSSLVASFELFLDRNSGSGYFTDSRDLCRATPDDVVKFLMDRDIKGRTQVHSLGCEHLGKPGIFECGCDRHLAAGTVDSYVGQLRAFFNSRGQTQPWREGQLSSNPCISHRVKRYIKAMKLEQAEAHVTPRQAMPMFSDKIRWLAQEIIKRRSLVPSGDQKSSIRRYIFHRDLAFFLCLWWAGERSSDLGRTKTCEITRIEGGDLLFNHTVGKTIREGSSALIIIPRLNGEELDPAGAVEEMVDFAQRNGFCLMDGYLFRPTAPDHRSLLNKPFIGNGLSKRLQLYFSESMDTTDASLRPHGGRAGIAATLRLLGATEEQVMDHCRWATHRTYQHYTRVERVTRRNTTVNMLKAALRAGEHDQPCEADLAGEFYRTLNTGSGLEMAFTAANCQP